RPTAVVSGTPTTCDGTSTTFSIAFTGTGPFVYTINGGSPVTATTNPEIVTVSPSVTTTYNVTSLSDASCAATPADITGSAVVTVNPRPTAVVSGTPTTCDGTSTTFSIAFTGTGPFVYEINGGSPVTATTNPEIVTVSPSVNTTYNVTSLSDGSCAATPADITGSAVVTVNPRPTAVVSGTPTTCDGTSTTFSIAFTGTGPFVYTINGGSPVTATTNPEIVTVSPSVTTTYNVTSLSDASCAATGADITGSAVVAVNPRPTAVV